MGGHPPPHPPLKVGLGEMRCVTPRQTCPRPEGFGRNLRSKTRWFTGFCNSHQVSHFATFFIDARAEISVAESRFNIMDWVPHPCIGEPGIDKAHTVLMFLGAYSAGVCYCARGTPPKVCAPLAKERGLATEGHSNTPSPYMMNMFAGQSAGQVSTMILPQVHLRKPCYDFSFL